MDSETHDEQGKCVQSWLRGELLDPGKVVLQKTML